jgi:hypothetical protein
MIALLPAPRLCRRLGRWTRASSSCTRPLVQLDRSRTRQATLTTAERAGGCRSTRQAPEQRPIARPEAVASVLEGRFGQAKKEQTPKEQQSVFLAQWGSCGMTTDNLVIELQAAGAVFKLEEHVFVGADQAAEARAHMSEIPGGLALLNCQFDQVHEMTIEVHPDGRRHLAQGYKGGYLAWWWQNQGPMRVDGGPMMAQQPLLHARRAQYGQGQDIQESFPPAPPRAPCRPSSATSTWAGAREVRSCCQGTRPCVPSASNSNPYDQPWWKSGAPAL